MCGLTIGAMLAGRTIRGRVVERPLHIYGAIELVIGLSGLVMLPGFALIAKLDALFFSVSPTLTPILNGFAILLLLGPPAIAMGASVPVFALIARAYGTSISWLYGMNTIGASLGVLLIGFVLLRALGVVYTTCFVASLNIFVFICTRLLERGSFTLEARGATHGRQLTRPLLTGCVIVFFTGFVTFGLEVAWFRAFRSAFHANTDSFAIMLAGVLLPLGIAPRFVPSSWQPGPSSSPHLSSSESGSTRSRRHPTPTSSRRDWRSRWASWDPRC
jgi:spermidine synthase